MPTPQQELERLFGIKDVSGLDEFQKQMIDDVSKSNRDELKQRELFRQGTIPAPRKKYWWVLYKYRSRFSAHDSEIEIVTQFHPFTFMKEMDLENAWLSNWKEISEAEYELFNSLQK